MPNKIPEDLGLVTGTKLKAFWTRVKNNCEAQIFESEQSMFILKENLELAEKKLKEDAR